MKEIQAGLAEQYFWIIKTCPHLSAFHEVSSLNPLNNLDQLLPCYNSAH